jgi:2-amino-4-hydroxy-6-hydroxymethyldihydropteridine diphosphokinase
LSRFDKINNNNQITVILPPMVQPNIVYLVTGANLGNPKLQLQKAAAQINKQVGAIVKTSAIYQTAAWGKTNQPNFLNQVIKVQTALTAQQVLETVLAIENKLGRVRTTKYAARVIDIDVLFYNKEIVQTKTLTLPHPLLHQRNFVLVPLNQIAPMLKHPLLNKNVHQLLLQCPDLLHVKKF